LRLSILDLVIHLVVALAALPRAAQPVMCFPCKLWIFAGRAARLRLPASLCELISSAGEQMRASSVPRACLCLVCARGLGRDSTRCLPTSNQFHRHPCDTPYRPPCPDFRLILNTRRTEPSWQSFSLPWVRVTSVITHACSLVCTLKPPETSPQPALRSPLRIIIIIERSPRPAVRTCVEV
jgi:hypothetical protein